MPAGKDKKKKAGKPPSKRKDFDKRMEDFAGEVECMGKRTGRHFEKGGKQLEAWWFRTFGLLGPVISSIFGVFLFAVFIWIIFLANLTVGSPMLSDVHNFLSMNLGLFFLFFLFFSYKGHLRNFYNRIYLPLSPLLEVTGIVIAVWVIVQLVNVVNLSLGIHMLTYSIYYLEANLVNIFWILLVVGYILLGVRTVYLNIEYHADRLVKEEEKLKRKPKKENVRRLYRSGKERILGGVCGGIAEYLGIDPVVIRLLWIALSLAWGSGILLYIIFWIVMPRNPEHEWKD